MAASSKEFDFEELSYTLDPRPDELDLLDTVQENGIVGSALEKVWVIREGLKEIKVLFDLGEFDSSLTSLEQISNRLDSFAATWKDSPPRVTRDLQTYLQDERNEINSTIMGTWHHAVRHEANDISATLRVNSNVSVGENYIDLNNLVEAVMRLDKDISKLPPQKRVLAPPAQIEALLVFIDDCIISPILDTKVGSVSVTADDDGASVLLLDGIQRSSAIAPGATGLDLLIEQLTAVINYLSAALRDYPVVYGLIIKRSSTRLVSTLCNKTLKSLLPIADKDGKTFEAHLVDLEVFETCLADNGWPRTTDLQNWIQNYPQEWIEHQKVLCLDEIRSRLLETTGELELKRVHDCQFAGAVNMELTVSESVPASSSSTAAASAENPKKGHKRAASEWENDWNAEFDDQADDGWGLDSDDIVISDNEGGGEGGGDDDWGWGDDEEPAISAVSKRRSVIGGKSKARKRNSVTVAPIAPSVSKSASTAHDDDKKSALMCSVSQYPAIIVSTIQKFIGECKQHDQTYKHNVGGSGSNVSVHISDMLALYRALCPIAYKRAPSGLIVHNDLTFLVNELDTNAEFTGQVSERERTKLVKVSHQYAAQELAGQQDRLNSVLKQANRFRNCNQEQDLFVCQATVERAINLFYEFSEEWAVYASFPQRVKALGTLLEYLCSTIISDIEHLGSISEEESMELSKLIGVIQQLEDLFTDPTTAAAGGAGGNMEGTSSSLTLYYTPSWIKFQYLSEVLQSKLVDILYLYNHNSLVDFSSQELVALIKALFAPSEHRRKAIEEIWSSA